MDIEGPPPCYSAPGAGVASSDLKTRGSAYSLIPPGLLAAHSLAWREDLQNHTFRHTVFCQEGSPSMGLSESYDEDLLFSFDFAKSTRVPRLPEFADWAEDRSDAPAIAFDKEFCEAMVQQLDPVFDGKIPVSRG